MGLLITGLLAFLLIHQIPATRYKEVIVNRFGAPAYGAVISILSLAAVVLAVIGYRRTDMTPLWQPITDSDIIAFVVMPIACVLLAAAFVPCNIGRKVRHPMLTAIALWAFVHLLSNGDLPSTLIFVTFGGYALYRRYTLVPQSIPATPIWRDGVAVVLGGVVFYGFYYFHEAISGAPLLLP